MTGFTHFTNGRAVRVDSPWPNDSRSRVTEWQDDGFAEKLYERLAPRWSTMPEDTLEQCDEGWRDTIVIRFDDGSLQVREGSCIRNPVAETLQVVFVDLASQAENRTETYVDGAIDGAYSPCFHEW
ncbi:hypothetical protein V8J82_17455 [Gymnodinialimonas sp. 2305UL16-5]|uniref:hypothetical protein n=1 Tax=Gymnodinialimonas mytili TaxID=3126503 RepID=UPI0030979FBE